MKFKHLQISQEAIQFQDGSFFKALTGAYKSFENEKPSAKQSASLGKLLASMIEQYVGMNCEVVIKDHETCIYVPEIDKNNVLYGEWFGWADNADGMKMIKKASGRSSGGIDLRKSRLSGDFSKYKPTIYIDLRLFTKLTSEELAAITLHEIGHFFTYCEMLDRMVSGNFVLLGLDAVLRSGADIKEKEIALEEAGKALGMDKAVVEDLKKSNSDKAVMTVYISEFAGSLKSQNCHNFYDMNAWEMASDQFAARHGGGRHVVTGLDKIYKMYGMSYSGGKFTYYLMEAMKVLRMITLLATAATTLAAGIAGSPFMLIYAVLLMGIGYLDLRSSHESGGTPTYDKPKDRALRVRRQLVEQLKQQTLPAEIIKSISEDIKIIDETIKDYYDQVGWLEQIDLFLFKSSRQRRDSVKLQQNLERLAMNDLFLQAAKLKTA